MENYKGHRAQHTELVNALRDDVLDSPGETDSPLRHAIEAHAAAHGGRPETDIADIPEILKGYVNKVALHAYKVTDDDIRALEEAGYSEDSIFEITLSATLGAGLARLERGLAALKGEG